MKIDYYQFVFNGSSIKSESAYRNSNSRLRYGFTLFVRTIL